MASQICWTTLVMLRVGDYVERDGADGVFEGLAGRVDGVEEIEDAEFRGFVEEKNDGMEDGEGEGDVAGEVVQAEIVEVAVRPLADGAVAEGHQGAEEHVERDGSYGGEADIGGEVQDGNVRGHWVVGRGSGGKGNAGKARKNINTERTEARAQRAQRKERLEAAEEFVEFVGGVEVGFEFAGVEALAEVVEAAGEEVEGGGEDFAIGEDDV